MADYFKKKHLIEFGEGKFGEDAPDYWISDKLTN